MHGRPVSFLIRILCRRSSLMLAVLALTLLIAGVSFVVNYDALVEAAASRALRLEIDEVGSAPDGTMSLAMHLEYDRKRAGWLMPLAPNEVGLYPGSLPWESTWPQRDLCFRDARGREYPIGQWQFFDISIDVRAKALTIKSGERLAGHLEVILDKPTSEPIRMTEVRVNVRSLMLNPNPPDASAATTPRERLLRQRRNCRFRLSSEISSQWHPIRVAVDPEQGFVPSLK